MNLVSIIIPVYNTKIEYLDRCFRSIQDQQIDNYEVIVIDDGSLKECASYLDFWAENDDRITIYHKCNEGVSVARNLGLSYSNGNYICFVDSDDVMGKGWLKNALNLATSTNADIVFGKVIICDVFEQQLDKKNFDYKYFEKEGIQKIRESLLVDDSYLLPDMPYIDHGQCAKLFKRSIINQVRFDERLKISEDQVFIHQLISNACGCVVCNYPAYYYIKNAESTSRNYMKDAMKMEAKAMEKVRMSIGEKNLEQQFYYRVIMDLRVAMDMELYSMKKSYSVYKRMIETFHIYRTPIYKEAIDKFEISLKMPIRDKIIVLLLKSKIGVCIYCLMKSLKKENL